MSPSEIVTTQIEVYNMRDLKGNMELFSENFQIIQFHDKSVLVDGKDACEKMYKDLFDNSPNLKAEIINRINYGNIIILQEVIYGRYGQKEGLDQLIMFEIVENKIERIYKF
jgi:hypothetical protein